MSENSFLSRLVDGIVMDWPEVHAKKMFGTDAWFAQGNIFAIINSSENKVGVRLSEANSYTAARKLKGAGDFAPGGQPMKNWVMFSQADSKKEMFLEPYLHQAHKIAMQLQPKALKTRGRSMV